MKFNDIYHQEQLMLRYLSFILKICCRISPTLSSAFFHPRDRVLCMPKSGAYSQQFCLGKMIHSRTSINLDNNTSKQEYQLLAIEFSTYPSSFTKMKAQKSALQVYQTNRDAQMQNIFLDDFWHSNLSLLLADVCFEHRLWFHQNLLSFNRASNPQHLVFESTCLQKKL